MPDIPKLDFIEAQGTRWPVSVLRPLLSMKPADLKAELQRLIGEAEPTEPTAESKES